MDVDGGCSRMMTRLISTKVRMEQQLPEIASLMTLKHIQASPTRMTSKINFSCVLELYEK